MLKMIATRLEEELKTQGITAEVTFCRSNMFSILVDDAAQFEMTKRIMASVTFAVFDSEEHDDECGHIAYYRF